MRMTFCLPEIPSIYRVNRFEEKCRKCGLEFETLLPKGDELVSFKEVGGSGERWLPTYGKGGYLDLIGKLLPGVNNKLMTTAICSFFINELLKNYTEPSNNDKVFAMPMSKPCCPKCGSDDTETSEPQLLVSPPLNWMKLPCVLMDETLFMDCQVWPYWERTVNVLGFYPEAGEDMIEAARELGAIPAEEQANILLKSEISKLIDIYETKNLLEEAVIIAAIKIRNILSGIMGTVIDTKEESRKDANHADIKRMALLHIRLYHSLNGALSQVESNTLEELEKVVWNDQIVLHPKIKTARTKFRIGDSVALKIPFISTAKGYAVASGCSTEINKASNTALLHSDNGNDLVVPFADLYYPST